MKKLILMLLLFAPVLIFAQPDWSAITTVEQACKAWPEQIDAVFQHLDLNRLGLENVREAREKNDLTAACTQLLTYYENSAMARKRAKEQPAPSDQTTGAGEKLLQHTFTFQQVAGTVPLLDNGHLQWDYEGPENDIEWAWALNRHYPLGSLLPEYYNTGNLRYSRYIDRFVKDWIIQSLPYPGVKSSTAMWRGLEVSFRVKMWAQLFYQLTGEAALSPATKLLILSSIPEHMHYARRFHGSNNWLTMEMTGLATAATSWPEFRESAEGLEYAVSAMTESLKEQVYPDGAQTELTSHYHHVAMSNFNLLDDICREAGVALPSDFTEQIEKMWNYLAWTIRPDGFGLLNNDADLDDNRERVLTAAAKYGRSDWKYIATNGESGLKPELPSVVFPWAGHVISRSGFVANAHWSFFDIGPWGSGHQHNDKLHLSVAAYGRDLLVDAGRFAYTGDVARKFRPYATGSQGHNVLLIDGKGQARGPRVTDTPVHESDYQLTSDHDLARGSFSAFNDLEGTCTHSRTVCYKRGQFWVVIDRVTTDRPRTIEALWHWHPTCEVEVRNEIVLTGNQRGNLQLVPAGRQKWSVKQIKGQEQPEIQGWYSKEFNEFEPNTTTAFETRVDGNSTFVWILYPSEGVERP
ncbi:MAG: alginate lyase family protein, partial [Mangrovibacterium sp.]|nr:alginate lyase family protein [Mangrovibacterium sp.]